MHTRYNKTFYLTWFLFLKMKTKDNAVLWKLILRYESLSHHIKNMKFGKKCLYALIIHSHLSALFTLIYFIYLGYFTVLLQPYRICPPTSLTSPPCRPWGQWRREWSLLTSSTPSHGTARCPVSWVSDGWKGGGVTRDINKAKKLKSPFNLDAWR